jgi:hypothetical protein
VDLADKSPLNEEGNVRPRRSERSLKPNPKYLGRAEDVGSWHAWQKTWEHACNVGKGWTRVVEINKQMCNRKWSSIIASLLYFIYVMIVLFYFVNFMCYVGRVYLLMFSFSL